MLIQNVFALKEDNQNCKGLKCKKIEPFITYYHFKLILWCIFDDINMLICKNLIKTRLKEKYIIIF